MRAREFVSEDKVGKLSKRLQAGTRGLNKFRDREFSDRVYELNRVMMAAACNDGDDFAEPVDAESWAGRNNIAAPYTEVEQRMLEKAYKAIGAKSWDLNHGDMDSEELSSVNKTSPVKAFKGYPR
jgi:hypothetical protein